MSASFDEPTIPPWLHRPLAAIWISLGLHAAVIALVQVVPQGSWNPDVQVIEARLVSAQRPSPEPEMSSSAAEIKTQEALPEKAPLSAPSEPAEALPVTRSVDPPPAAPTPVPSPAGTPADPQPASAEPAPSGVIVSAVDLTYYTARDVDVHPRALRKIVPDYPVDAERQNLSGSVRLQLKLEADGRISSIGVVNETPPGVFSESAIKAFREARFSPAQRNGRPVRALVLIEVVFDLEAQQR